MAVDEAALILAGTDQGYDWRARAMIVKNARV
jgi:hypothetical protein